MNKIIAILSMVTLLLLSSCGDHSSTSVGDTATQLQAEVVVVDEDNTAQDSQAGFLVQESDVNDKKILSHEEVETTAHREKIEIKKTTEQDEKVISETKTKVLEEKQAQERVVQKTAVTDTQTLKSGTLGKVQVKTSGTVKFVEKGDSQIIEISNFSTASAPDLGIYLSKKSSLNSSADIIGAIKLAQLKSPSGNQTYIVPSHIDLSEYNSIAIHCTSYNKLFGSASLE